MKDGNFITIIGWMVNKLKLSGNDLMVYAMIYGFSQDGKSGYEGGGKYLCSSCSVSRRTLTLILDKLLKKNYILKEYLIKKNAKFCRLKTNPDFIPEKDEKKEEPNNEGMAETATGGNGKNCHKGYGKNCHKGMANIANNNISSNINITTTTSEKPESKTDPPLDDGNTDADAALTPEKINNYLSALDNRLIFSDAFYPRAAAFMSRHDLDLKYLDWLHEICVVKEPDIFDSYYFKLFFLENKAKQYKSINKPAPPLMPQPPPPFITAPSAAALTPCKMKDAPFADSPIRITLKAAMSRSTAGCTPFLRTNAQNILPKKIKFIRSADTILKKLF